MYAARSSRASNVSIANSLYAPAGEDDDGPGVQEWLEKMGDFVSHLQ